MRPRIQLEPALRHSPFTVLEGRQSGLGERRLYGRDLVRPFHGVRISGDLGDDLATQCAAYASRCAPDVFSSHLTAAALWDVPLPQGTPRSALDVSVPRPRRAPEGRGVRGHSVRVDDTEVIERRGLQVSSPVRLWCELGAILGADDLVVAGDFMIRREDPLASKDDLASGIEAFPGRRGLRNLREALDSIDERSESPQESRIRLALVRAGIPGLEVNVPIRGASGRVHRVDFAFLHRGVVLEYQGDYHRERAQFRRDMTRTLDLQTAGLTVIMLGPDDIRSEPAFVARMRDLLRLHGDSRHIDLPWGREGRVAAARRLEVRGEGARAERGGS